MKQKIIVSNLRTPEDDWLQVKIRAAELNMSVNEYLNWLVQKDIVRAQLEPKEKRKKKKSIYALLFELANKKYKRKPMGASEDDKAIYDI